MRDAFHARARAATPENSHLRVSRMLRRLAMSPIPRFAVPSFPALSASAIKRASAFIKLSRGGNTLPLK